MERFYALDTVNKQLVPLEEYCDPYEWDRQTEVFESYDHTDLAHFINTAKDPGELSLAQIMELDIDITLSEAMEAYDYARFLFFVMEHSRNFVIWVEHGEFIEDIVAEGLIDPYITKGYRIDG